MCFTLHLTPILASCHILSLAECGKKLPKIELIMGQKNNKSFVQNNFFEMFNCRSPAKTTVFFASQLLKNGSD